ncbi:spermidine/putrescine ABC transporter ATP-binding protein [Virgibacillus phasianinus]|uniref:Spermidine/putrescine ABC transporter ATP-binding protein n=1 Tax=Virgibacillus phasianinus TaxID=2017483 RepID=A0A220U407_9BACI|nr:ABC transporter ATP-binding protein [Virgibacillus phasianinus]ASK62898.1 spermidine/putrescine ABC transporter ATP-binding protein [Virgibacillus phasianinus]
MAFLTLDNLSHHYFSEKSYTQALDSISLSINEGEFISLLGPSGCGKSTILSIIAGIISQTTGEVILEEKPLKETSLAIGYMLQQDYLFPWKSVLENIMIGQKINGSITMETKERAQQLLKEVGLPNVANDYPRSLSGGMRQRAALVRTLLTDPKILLLDEPFSALDYQTKLKLEDLVFQLLQAYKKTSILVTHDIGEAIAMSDRIILMASNPGRIAKTFDVPIEIRTITPFEARKHPKYQMLFDRIWKELDKHEKTDE